MTQVDELLARLEQISTGDHERGCPGREYHCDCQYDNNNAKTAIEAAALIRSQQNEIAALRGALEPFADEADRHQSIALGPDIDNWPVLQTKGLTLGHLRRARAAGRREG